MAATTSYMPQTKVAWCAKDSLQNFKVWRREVERIIGGPMKDNEEDVNLNHVFIWAGGEAETLAEAKQAEDPALKIEKPKDLLDCLEKCLTHSTYFREARDDFYNMRQNPEDNITTYYSRIIRLFKLAEFPDGSNFLIVDRLIHGCTNTKCKEKLMAEGKDVTVKRCLERLRQQEAVQTTMKRFGEDVKITAAYRSHDPTKRSQKNGDKQRRKKPQGQGQASGTGSAEWQKKCRWCAGGQHSRENCPAKEAKCDFCHKKGHYGKACRIKKKAKHQYAVAASESDTSDNDAEYEHTSSFDMGAVTINNITTKAREVLANVTFHTTQKKSVVQLQGKVDTGAMVTCMPSKLLKSISLKSSDLTPSKVTLRGVTGTDMVTCGELKVKVTCNGHTDEVRIIVTDTGTELILGLDFCKAFKLIEVAECCIQRRITVDEVKAVHITDEGEVNYTSLQKKWKQHIPLGKKTGDPLKDLKAIFPETFDGSVGLFEGEVKLQVTPEVKPVQLPPRAVPLSVMSKLKEELDKMENEGIIRPCPETTDWVHNLVIVSKKNGDMRLCLDPRNLNKYLVRSLHYTASWDDAQHSFRNGKYFSTLDAKSGYWTKMLSKESQLLTAFNSPF